MKRGLSIILLLLILFVGAPQEQVAYAESEEEETISSILDGVDLSQYQEFFDNIKEEYNMNLSDSIKKIVTDIIYQRSDLTADSLLKSIVDLVIGNIGGYVAQMSVIVIVCLLLSLLSNLSSGFSSRSIEKIVYLACYSVIVAIVLSLSGTVVTDTVKMIETFTFFTETIFPPLLTIMTAIGSVSATGLYQPSLLFFSATILTVIKQIVLPLFYLCFVLTVVSHLNDEIKLKKMIKTARSLAEWTLSISFGIFTMITSAKGIAGAGLDNFAIRSAKYALSGYVPIIGSYLKEGVDIVVASCIIVKNAVGVTAVFLLLLAVLSPIIKILLAMFSLRITAAIVEPFGAEKVSTMLYDVSDCLKMLAILVLCMTFSVFILLLLILLTCNGGVV